jgi:transposase
MCQQALKQASKQLQAQGVRHCDTEKMQLLQSIPGLGPITAARIQAEVGDVSRFSHAKQLIAYAGLDPSVHSSGNTTRMGRLTKRGSPHLRHALFIAASVARRYDPELKLVYDRKRSEGKAYTQAVTHIARLMVYRIYAVLSRGTVFVKKGCGS